MFSFDGWGQLHGNFQGSAGDMGLVSSVGRDRPQPSKLNMISAHGTDQTHVSSTALEVTMKLTLMTAAVALIRFVIYHSSSFIFIEFVLLRLIQVTSMCK